MRILLLGAGHQAQAIAYDILRNPKLEALVLADSDVAAARRLARRFGARRCRPTALDVTQRRALERALQGMDCAIGATTYAHNVALTRACIDAGVSFCDLGGNNDVVAAQLRMHARAKAAGVTVIPDCGLAPGMMTLLAYHWAQAFQRVEHLKIRVGGLPQEPRTPLRYQLVFSVEGLINEYVEPAVALRGGKRVVLEPFSELESLSFGARFGELEAFSTSGGTSTLPRTLAGVARNLDYKTIRYAGHCSMFRMLYELGLCSSEPRKTNGVEVVPRKLLGSLLREHLPTNEPDVVLTRVDILGRINGRRVVRRYDGIDYYDARTRLTAMQRTTGFPVAIIAQMLAAKEIKVKGVVPQELAVDGAEFLRRLSKRRIRFSAATRSA